MKTLTSYIISFVCFITLASFASNTITAKPTNCFSQFRIHRMANDVALTWAVATTDVSGFVIERSYDGDMYEPVTQVACNGNSVHKYRDSEVYPGYIHYRIAAIKTNGSTEYSAIATVRIVKRR